MVSAEASLWELGIQLPQASTPFGAYVEAVQMAICCSSAACFLRRTRSRNLLGVLARNWSHGVAQWEMGPRPSRRKATDLAGSSVSHLLGKPARRPNHRGIPATTSSAGDPPLEQNPSSSPRDPARETIAPIGFSHGLDPQGTSGTHLITRSQDGFSAKADAIRGALAIPSNLARPDALLLSLAPRVVAILVKDQVGDLPGVHREEL
jgi:hypothetical protein